MRIPATVALLLTGACIRVPVPATAGRPAPTTVSAGEPRGESHAVATAGSSFDAAEYVRERDLLLPVSGADPAKIRDSFSAPRDGGRTHRALDILAPRGTPILSADAGHILRLSNSRLGGITIYAVDPSGQIVYYYAHLNGYRDGLREGMSLARGDILGYVGTTGNAPEDTPHLHFQIMRMPDDGKYWDGDPINPYPLFAAGNDR